MVESGDEDRRSGRVRAGPRAAPAGLTGASLRRGVAKAVERSHAYFLRTQAPQGYWWGELESNVAITAEYLLLTHFMGVADAGRWRKITNYIKRRQLADGGWPRYHGAPGDLSISVEAYFALKLAGEDPESEPMQRARAFVLANGGPSNARIFTKCWLALFGQWDWNGVPMMPPEFILSPARSPFSIYDFAAWARATVVAMLILMTTRPTRPIPERARIDDLYPTPADRRRYNIYHRSDALFSWRNGFILADKLLGLYHRSPLKPLRGLALRRCARWLVEHQEEDGSLAGIQPPWVYAIMGLHSLGYALDHPVIERGLAGFEAFAHETEDEFWTEPCLSPVWDTALAATALVDSGLPRDHAALVQAGEWLLSEQVYAPGDWQVRSRARPGGWAFEFANDLYPDTDDTAEAMIALKKIAQPEERVNGPLQRGWEWLVGMQSRGGGWGSFDKNNDRHFVTQVPFADFGETIDWPTEDVTAHVIEMMGLCGYDRRYPVIDRAVRYLQSTQEPDGAWWGRWGVNYLYGVGAVLPALQAVGEDMRQPYVRRAVEWLLAHQLPDGGWGESCATYDDPSRRGDGPSTASQTAWALMALLAAGEDASDAATSGVGYLLTTQRDDGQWEEPQFTGTGFPGHFLIKYHLYRNYFPLMALGRYKRYLDRQRVLPML